MPISIASMRTIAQSGVSIMLSSIALSSLIGAAYAASPIELVDDAGRKVVLKAPARRIVSLAPSTTELLFAAGAGKFVVGTSRYSDYPQAARTLPIVNDATTIDAERIASLKPDLLIVWQSGTAQSLVDRLKVLNLPIYYSEPKRLESVAKSLRDFGMLTGNAAEAERAAAAYSLRLRDLRATYASKPPVRVFFQIWDRPLMTINGKQMISDAISVCGGVNIFSALPQTAPTVAQEAVIAADPEAIATTYGGEGADGLDGWRKLKRMRATARGNLIALKTPTLSQQTPRSLDGADLLCRELDKVRLRRPRFERPSLEHSNPAKR